MRMTLQLNLSIADARSETLGIWASFEQIVQIARVDFTPFGKFSLMRSAAVVMRSKENESGDGDGTQYPCVTSALSKLCHGHSGAAAPAGPVDLNFLSD